MVHRTDDALQLAGRTWVSVGAVALGLALVGYGYATHLSVVGRARCDGCAPFHPLFVLAPVAAGLLAVAAGIAVARR